MPKNFSVLLAKMTPAARKQVEQQTQILLAEMPFNELRRARSLSQKMLADALNVQ